MWFRIELDKTGAILACEQVAEGFNGSKYVRFVEAETKAAACSSAKAWWELQLQRCRDSKERLRSRRLKEGRCSECEQPRKNARHCAKHAEEARLRNARLRRGTPPERPEPAPRTAHERLVAAKEPSLKLRVILREFDARGPDAFRAWVTALLADNESGLAHLAAAE